MSDPRGVRPATVRGERRERRLLRPLLAVTAALGVVVLAVASFQRVLVCEEQVAQTGDVVETCRHLQATDPPVLAAGILLLLIIAILFDLNEVGFLGVSMKRNLADAKAAAESADRARVGAEEAATSAGSAQEGAERAAVSAAHALAGAKDAATSAHQAQEGAEKAGSNATEAASFAKEAAQHARGAERSAAKMDEFMRSTLKRSPSGAPVESTSRAEALVTVEQLIAKYNLIRKKKASGDERTEDMTGVVSDMISLFSVAGPNLGSETASWLTAEDRGRRLAAYAYFHTFPDPRLTDPLARSCMLEDNRPFGQYWGLRALRRHVEIDRSALNRNTRRSLEEMLQRVGSWTDRGHELVEILRLTADRPDTAR